MVRLFKGMPLKRIRQIFFMWLANTLPLRGYQRWRLVKWGGGRCTRALLDIPQRVFRQRGTTPYYNRERCYNNTRHHYTYAFS